MPNTSAKTAVAVSPFESMTGYATLEKEIGGKRFRLQAKSVNHRFLELKWRAPREWGSLEVLARQSAQKTLRRGAVDVSIEVSDRRETVKPEEQAAKVVAAYERALERVQSNTMLSRSECASLLERTTSLWMGDKTPDEDLPADEAEKAFTELFQSLGRNRRTEGDRLKDLLQTHITKMGALLTEITARLEPARKLWAEQLKKRLEELAAEMKIAGPGQEKLLQELLFLAEKREVSEEIGRIGIHLGACQKLLADGDAAPGKRLEFLAQELHREWTTLGNKVQDAELAQKIIDGKLEIEKIREQCLNLA